MNRALVIVAVVLLCAAPPLLARDAGGVIVSHSETLQNFSIERHRAQSMPEALQKVPSTLVFDALGQRFELELEPNTRLVSAAFPGGLANDIGVYRGRLAGKPDSWVRVVMSKGVPTGLIWDGTEMLAIEPLNGTDTASIYRLKDTWVEPGMMSCGSAGKDTSLAAAYATVAGELEAIVSQAAGAVDELKIGLVGDFEFTSANGVNAESEILARMNNVDGIFSEQLGVQITVDVIETFPTSNDPFTTTTVPNALLDELAGYRSNTAAQNSQGLTHLFTGRNLDGTTAGIAFTGVLCQPRVGVGLTEGTRGVVTDSLVAAHEIGHNFGAEHDGETGSACESVTGTFLMSPRVSSADQFSTCSIDTMRPFIDGASCINPLPATDVAIALSGNLPTFLLGIRSDLVFDVANSGTQDATNVIASFALPANLALDSIAATVGSCTSGAGQASCSIGTIPGGSSVSVALSVTAASIGTDTLDASVTADGDVNPGDNSQSLQVVVAAATDLRVANTAARSVTLNGSVAINPRIDNLSTLDATDLALSISFSGGLRVDSASWPDGTCTVGANAVNCQLASLAAGSNVSLDIQLTATAAGSQTYTANITSLQADANEADNNVTGTVNVSSPSGSGSSGGGGAFGLVWLLLSGFAAFAVRSSRQ